MICNPRRLLGVDPPGRRSTRLKICLSRSNLAGTAAPCACAIISSFFLYSLPFALCVNKSSRVSNPIVRQSSNTKKVKTNVFETSIESARRARVKTTASSLRDRRRSVFSRTSSCIACTGCFVFDDPTSRAAASPRRSVSTGLLKNLISSSILPFVVVGASSSRAGFHASANVFSTLWFRAWMRARSVVWSDASVAVCRASVLCN